RHALGVLDRVGALPLCPLGHTSLDGGFHGCLILIICSYYFGSSIRAKKISKSPTLYTDPRRPPMSISSSKLPTNTSLFGLCLAASTWLKRLPPNVLPNRNPPVRS